MEEVIREYIRVAGHVQGVGFRYRTQRAAESLGLTGWVANLWNGEVELEVQGTGDEITEMLEMVARSRYIRIDSITRRKIPREEGERSFHIR